jgi:hypothetical protein
VLDVLDEKMRLRVPITLKWVKSFICVNNARDGRIHVDAKEEKKEEYYKGKEVKGAKEKKKEEYRSKEVKGEK